VPAEVRFWAKVERRAANECWPWTGATVRARGGTLEYGRFWVPGEWLGRDGKSCQLAHRVAFYLAHGRWPDSQALHGCDFPLCCNAENPLHVHEGTPRDNTREMFERGRGHLPPVLLGERAGRSRLTDVQALEIIARYADGKGGVSQDALAVEYGVSQHAVNYTVRGRRRSLQ
jgi:hypothetical protein